MLGHSQWADIHISLLNSCWTSLTKGFLPATQHTEHVSSEGNIVFPLTRRDINQQAWNVILHQYSCLLKIHHSVLPALSWNFVQLSLIWNGFSFIKNTAIGKILYLNSYLIISLLFYWKVYPNHWNAKTFPKNGFTLKPNTRLGRARCKKTSHLSSTPFWGSTRVPPVRITSS